MSKPKAEMNFDRGIGPHASVPPDRYAEIARQHVAATGGDGVVVDERKTPRQWRAWLAYFAWLDGQTWPRGRKATAARQMRNGVTVPTEWPIAFDLSAPPATAAFFDPEAEAELTLQRRSELGSMLRQAAAGFAPPPARRTPPPDARSAQTPDLEAQAAAHHEARLAELANAPWPTPSPVLDKYLDAMRPPGRAPPPSDERAWPQAEEDGDDAAAAW